MEHYTLHARERELLYYLNSRHGIVTAKELAKKMAVSERTIRSDIVRINEAMKNCGIFVRAVYGKGYSLQIRDRAVFQRLFSEEKNIQTKEDRIRYLILKLVRSEGSCNMQDLEDDIYICRTTLEKDFREVQARISENQPYLQINRHGNEILVEENELKRRNILIYLYCSDWDYDSRDGITLKDSLIDKGVLDQIRIELKLVLDGYEIELDDFGLIYLTIALGVCYARALEGKMLVLPEEWKRKKTEREKKYEEAALELTKRMTRIWEVDIEEDVCFWLSSILIQLSILNLNHISWQTALENVEAVSVEIEKILLDRIEKEYGVSLKEDENFMASLLLHIQAWRNGMISFQPQNRYVLENLKLQFPFLGDIVHYMCGYLEELCKIKLGPDMENYFLPLLVLNSINQLKRKQSYEMRIAVVSHFNSGLTHYLMEMLRRNYGSRVEFVGPFPVYDRNRMDSVKPVCILTTVQMDVFRQFDVPVITVSAQLTRNEQEKIEQQIQKMEEACLYLELPAERSHYFRSDLIMRLHQKMSLQEVMEAMVKQIEKTDVIGRGVKLNLDNCYYTLLANGSLFTYTVVDEAVNSVFSMADLENVITWKQQRGIRRVLLLLLNAEEKKYLGSFYLLAKDIAEHNT